MSYHKVALKLFTSLIIAMGLGLVLVLLPAQAAACTWTGYSTSSANWEDSANWSGCTGATGLPGIGDTVVILTGGGRGIPVVATSNVTIKDLDLTYGASVVVDGGLKVTNLISLTSGSLSGSGIITVAGTMSWTGGAMSSTSTITHGVTNILAGAVVTISNIGNSKFVNGRTINNYGKINWTGGAFELNDGAVFNNFAGSLFDMQADDFLSHATGAGSTFNNAGVLRKSGSNGGFGYKLFDVNTFTNTGIVDVVTGTLGLSATNSVDIGITTVANGSTYDLNGYTYLFQAGSVITGAGNINFNHTGVVTVAGSYFNGGSTNVFNNVDFKNATLVNFNNLNHNGGSLNLDNPSVIVRGGLYLASSNFNAGTGTIAFTGAVTQLVEIFTPVSFYNLIVDNGTVINDASTNTAVINGTLTNNGVIHRSANVNIGMNDFGLTGVKLDVTSQGGLSSVQVDRIGLNHPNANFQTSTGEHWQITPNGSGFNLNMTLPHSVTPHTSANVCRYTGTVWDCGRSSSSANAVTRTNIITLSDWAVGITTVITGVNSLNDDNIVNGNCTLREAIIAANTNSVVDACAAGNPGLDTIILASGVYSLTINGASEDLANTGDLDITESLTIIGAISNTTVIDAALLGDRVFHVLTGTVKFDGLTVQNGNVLTTGNGGGIFNQADLRLVDTIVTSNTADLGGGVYISSSGAVTLTGNTNVTNNTAFNYGGGIYIFGINASLIQTAGTIIQFNSTNFDGGGLYNNQGIVNINNGQVGNNISSRWGGGLYNNLGTVNINNGQVVNNTSSSEGGGFANIGTLKLIDSTVVSNTASKGGGFWNNGTIVLTNTTVASNTANIDGGGIFNGGTIELTRVTISENLANGGQGGQGGGLYNAGEATLINVTVSSNIANSAAGVGGGIYANAGTVTMTNVSVVSNTANSRGGGIFDATSSFVMGNSLLAYNIGGDCSVTTVTSLGFNLSSDGSCGLNFTGDITSTDPLLGPLQNNGGTLETHALLPGSPAVDKGSCTIAPSTDQRGLVRPNNGSSLCDIGAFELQAVFPDLSITKQVNPTSAIQGQSITYTVAYSNVGNATATGVVISDMEGFGLITAVSYQSSGVVITANGVITQIGSVSWNVADLAPGNGGIITITGQMESNKAVVANTVTIVSNEVDMDNKNNSAVVAVNVTTLITGVNSLNDDNIVNGNCTLREAIIAANTNSIVDACAAGNPGLDTIILASGVYSLTINGASEDLANTGDLDITESLTIIGAVSNTTVIDAALLGDRVFHVLTGTVQFDRLTVQNGNVLTNVNGGGIFNQADLRLVDTIVTSNTADLGGGVYIMGSGTVTLTGNTNVTNNTAFNYGGGVYIFGTNASLIQTAGTIIQFNSTQFDGGGLYNNQGRVDITSGQIKNNNASRNGGGFVNVGGTLKLIDSTVERNTANAKGGGFWNGGTMVMTNTVIVSNTANIDGGGIFSGGIIKLTRVTISENIANGGQGGGLHNTNGKFTLINVTISSNSAAGVGGGSAAGVGGGIYANAGTVTMTNVSVVSNSAKSRGGGIFDATSSFVVGNSLLAYNIGGDCSATTITSLGYNLNSDSSCGLKATGDITSTDPLLGPLQNNGGTLKTHALMPGSPAVDKGSCAIAPLTDQRGLVRPNNGSSFCDIGAFELQAVFPDLSISKTVNAPNPIPGQTITYTLSFSNAGFGTATGVIITDIMPSQLSGVNFLWSADAGAVITPMLGITNVWVANGLQVNTGGAVIVEWIVSDLQFNAGGTITITGQIKPGVVGMITNTVTITSNISDTNNKNNSATAAVNVMAGADLSITKQVNPAFTAIQGQLITYTITYSNVGNATATGVVITDVVPAGLTAVNYRSSGVVITPTGGANYSWNVADLAPGQAGTITITGQVSTGITGVITNTVTIASSTGDSNSNNNTASALLSVYVPSALSISKHAPGSVKAGELITYTLVVTNSNSYATYFAITDTIPAGSNLVSIPYSGAWGSVFDGTVSWSFNSVAPGSTVKSQFVVTASYGITTVVNDSYGISTAGYLSPGVIPVVTTILQQLGFGSHTQVMTDSYRTHAVKAGDVDGDGDKDLISGNGSPNTVWLNDGDGNFSDSGQLLGSGTTQDVTLGDVDGDGDLDMITANDNGEANKLWLNDGNGNFSDSGQSMGSSSSQAVQLGDVDGDGDLDAFVGNGSNQSNEVWLNDGSGSFSNSGANIGGSDSNAVQLGDVDGDGDLDVFIGNGSNQSNEVWLNDGSGSFSDSGLNTGSSDSQAVDLGDIDGDGDLDAFIGNGSGQASQVWLNDGSGSFTDSGLDMGGSSDSNAVQLSDVDGDGDLDVVTAGNGTTSVMLNDGSGNFTDSGLNLGASDGQAVVIDDLNGDGMPDIFVGNAGTTGESNQVLMNQNIINATIGSSGGSIESTFGLTVTVEVPAGLLGQSTAFTYTQLGQPSQAIPNSLKFANSSFTLVSNPTFNGAINLTVNYNPTGLTPDKLKLYMWDTASSKWVDVATTCSPTSTYERGTGYIKVAACHLTEFALFSEKGTQSIYLPVIIKN